VTDLRDISQSLNYCRQGKGHHVSLNNLWILLKLAHLACSWGESAGAVSVGWHLVANGGNPGALFGGAIMVASP